MLLFKIKEILSTTAIDYNDQFDGIDHSGVSFMGQVEMRRETGEILCSIEIKSGSFDELSNLRFVRTPNILGNIIDHSFDGFEHVARISFRTIFFHGFDYMIRELIRSGDNVIAISTKERNELKFIEKQRDLLDLLITLYLPSKRNEIINLATIAFALEPTTEDSKSYFNCDPFIPGQPEDFLYCYLAKEDLDPYVPALVKADIAISFGTSGTRYGEIWYNGKIHSNVSLDKVMKRQSMKVQPFLDLPSDDSPFIEELQFSKHAIRKYKTISNFLRDAVLGDDSERTQLFGYPTALQESIEGACVRNVESKTKISDTEDRLTAWHLFIQITEAQFESDFNSQLAGGMLYVMMKSDSGEDTDTMKICTIAQYT